MCVGGGGSVSGWGGAERLLQTFDIPKVALSEFIVASRPQSTCKVHRDHKEH